MIVLVSGQTKQLCCFSDVACQAAQKSGLTEMSMEDHTVTQLMKDRKVSLTLERPWSRCHVLFFFGELNAGFLEISIVTGRCACPLPLHHRWKSPSERV